MSLSSPYNNYFIIKKKVLCPGRKKEFLFRGIVCDVKSYVLLISSGFRNDQNGAYEHVVRVDIGIGTHEAVESYAMLFGD